MVIRGLETLTGRHALLRRARGYDDAVAEGAIFWEEMASRYGLYPDIVRGTLDLIPREGPVVVVANHPYGILDGLMLSLLLSRVRPQGFKIVANDVFLRAPDLADAILPVCFDDTRAGQTTNLSMRRTALAYLARRRHRRRLSRRHGLYPGPSVRPGPRPLLARLFGEADPAIGCDGRSSAFPGIEFASVPACQPRPCNAADGSSGPRIQGARRRTRSGVGRSTAVTRRNCGDSRKSGGSDGGSARKDLSGRAGGCRIGLRLGQTESGLHMNATTPARA